jgi:hypothetical protein
MLNELSLILLTFIWWYYLQPVNPSFIFFLPLGLLLLATITIFNLWETAWLCEIAQILVSPLLFYTVLYMDSAGYAALFGQHTILQTLFLSFASVYLFALKAEVSGPF